MNIEPSSDNLDVEGGQEGGMAHHSLPPTSNGISRRTTMIRQRRQRRFLVGIILSLAVVGAVVGLSVVLSRDEKSNESSGTVAETNALNNNPDATFPSTSPPTMATTTTTTSAPPATSPPVSVITSPPSNTVVATTLTPSSTVTSNVFQAPVVAPTPPPNLAPVVTPSPTVSPTLPPTASPTVSPTVSPTSSPTVSPSVAPLTRTVRGSYELLETVAHDAGAFTQGLEVLSLQRLAHDTNDLTTVNATTTTTAHYFLESTGLFGQSTLRIVEIGTGEVVESLNVDGQYFAEGCTYYRIANEDDDDTIKLKIVQLTWQSGTGLVYELSVDALQDVATSATTTTAVPFGLELVGTFDIDTTNGEGWGIVYHPTLDQFIVSDGTDNIHFWELRESPAGDGDLVFELVRTQQVTRRFSAGSAWTGVVRLNELEWDPYSKDGTTILANVWQTDDIVRIRLEDGKVTHQYDMSSLDRQSGANVLNGIAAVWDSTAPIDASSSTSNQFWVTGKRWDSMYRVQFDD